MNSHEITATDQLECALAQYGCPARLSALDCGRGLWGVFVNERSWVCFDALVQAADRLGYTVTEWHSVGHGMAAWLERAGD
jgi:glycine cleavage system aminomethyltransferase T